MKLKHILISLVFVLCSVGGWSQTKTQAKAKDWNLSASGGAGYVLNSFEGRDEMLDSFVYPFFDVRVGYHTSPTNASAYAGYYGYPTLGIGFSWRGLNKLNFKENAEFGNIPSLYGFVEGDFVRTRHFSLGYDASFGLAYTPSVYNPETNPNNRAFGSHLVMAITPGILLKFRPAQHLELGASARLCHMSTGRLAMPNRGLNLPEVSLYARYAASEPSREKAEKTPFQRRMVYDVSLGMGLHRCQMQWHYFDENIITWANYCLSTSASYRYSRIMSSGLGLDFFLDQQAFLDKVKEVEMVFYPQEHPEDAVYDPFACGISAVHHFYYGNLSFWGQVGVYLYKKKGLYEERGSTYQRIGVQYVFPKLGNFYVGADCRIRDIAYAVCMEFTVGVQI